MTGEELNRKYHELKGWPKRSGELLACPPLHLDANLAIAEADKVFLNNDGKPDYSLPRNRNGWYVERFIQTREVYGRQMWHAETLCEAILKALIAAGGK